MLQRIFEQLVGKYIREAYVRGVAVGMELGIKIGKARAGDKGIVISARVDSEVEDIMRRYPL